MAIGAASFALLVVMASPVMGGRPGGSGRGDAVSQQLRFLGIASGDLESETAAPEPSLGWLQVPANATPTSTPTPSPTSTPTPSPTPSPTPTLAPINPPGSAADPAWNGLAAPTISAAAAIIVDEASGAVLFQKHAHEPLAPASLTKIATAVVALQQGDLEQWVEIEVDSREMVGSSLMGLLPGDRFTLNHLLYGLMLPSGNDAALEIGRAVSGSVDEFVDEMNALAQELGLHNTHFENPHGLDEDGHFMSAYDLAMLSRYAMAMDSFWPYSSTKYITVWGNRQVLLKNLNPVLYFYPGGDGVKTGFTDDAGKTLVGSATRNGHRVYVVLLNAPEREGDALVLFDWAFNAHIWP